MNVSDPEHDANAMLTMLNGAVAVHYLEWDAETRRRPDDPEWARRCWRKLQQAIEPIEKQRMCIIDALVTLRAARPIQIVATTGN